MVKAVLRFTLSLDISDSIGATVGETAKSVGGSRQSHTTHSSLQTKTAPH